jgi:hypothetical protein
MRHDYKTYSYATMRRRTWSTYVDSLRFFDEAVQLPHLFECEFVPAFFFDDSGNFFSKWFDI